MKDYKWVFACRTCGYAREYSKEHQVQQSAANHRADKKDHITILHYGFISDLRIATPERERELAELAPRGTESP